jgi:hypothetical protein
MVAAAALLDRERDGVRNSTRGMEQKGFLSVPHRSFAFMTAASIC